MCLRAKLLVLPKFFDFMEFTANQIADFLEGKVQGNGEIKVSNVSKIEEGTIGTLAFLANPKYTPYIYTTKASIVLVNKDFVPEKPIQATLIFVNNAYESFASLLELVAQTMFQEQKGIENPSFIHETTQYGENFYLGAFAYIGKNVKIGNNVKIYPQAYIGDNVKIDDDTTIYSGAKIYYNCILGKNVTIHAGAVIGADGFGFAPTDTTNYKKIPQIGNVIIESFVEIGANTCIDRATVGSTIIHKGVKLDNLIQIGHNVKIDKNTVMAALTGIAGSTKIGKNCMFGGQVGVAGHLSIADEVKAAAMSGIAGNIREKGKIVMGAPAFEVKDFQRSYVILRKLPELNKKIQNLEKEIEKLKNK